VVANSSKNPPSSGPSAAKIKYRFMLHHLAPLPSIAVSLLRELVPDCQPAAFPKVSVKGQLENVKPTEKIRAIAEIINQWVGQLTDTCEDCGQFQIKVEKETLNLEPAFKDPDPFK